MRLFLLVLCLAVSAAAHAAAEPYSPVAAISTGIMPWGYILGDIDRQLDLKRRLDEKQPLITTDLSVPGILYAPDVCSHTVEVSTVRFDDGTALNSAKIDGGEW